MAAASAVISACAESSPSTASTPTDAPPPAAAQAGPVVVTDVVADELVASVSRAQDGTTRHVVRWPTGATVRVGVQGSPTDSDLEVLERSIAALGSGLPITLERTEGDADVVIAFAPKSDWAGIVDDPNVDLGVAGWTYTATQGSQRRPDVAGELAEATIVVDSDIPQVARNRVIAHELGHALGLGHSGCPATLMSDAEAARPLWSPTPLDTEVLALLYNPTVEPGMSVAEVEAVLDRTGTIGARCGAVEWQLVEFSGVAYYCRAGQGPRPCIVATDDEPTLPLTQADGWVDDGGFSYYDPTLWTEYLFEGDRLLCERSDDTYRPCVRFDGTEVPEHPVGDAHYWTDGAVIYDSPPS